MKYWWKKLAAIFLCAIMVTGLIPGIMSVAKAEDYQLWVGNVRVTSTNTSGNCDGGGTWSYSGDGTSGTLTLENATIRTYTYNANIWSEVSNLTICLKGSNTLSGTAYAIYSEHDIVIKGQNNQARSDSMTASGYLFAFRIHGNITISDGCTVEANGNDHGIYALNLADNVGTVTIQNSTVTANGDYGIFAHNNIVIENSTVNAINSKYGGIYSASGSVTITNSTVHVFASTYYGIFSNSSSFTVIDDKSLVTAAGAGKAIRGPLKNAATGNGWNNMDGTGDSAAIPVSSGGQTLDYKLVKIDPYAAEPVFSPAAGRYEDKRQVTISCSTAGADIYYTTDGSTPTSLSGTKYTGTIDVDKTTTIKAIAVKEGLFNSAVVSATYTIPYQLKYDANGGSGSMDSQKVYDGDTFTFPECGFGAPAGKVFDHWKMSGVDSTSNNVNANEQVVNGVFNPGSTVKIASNCAQDGVITVTAHWGNHTHSWSYSASGATITATCSGAGTCGITDGKTITISAPAAPLSYDGNAKAATLSTGYNTTAFPDTYSIRYQGTGSTSYDSTDAPSDAGTYQASVTAGKATASVSFEITKATQAAPAAPAAESVTGTSVTLKETDGYEYSMDGITWQAGNVFENLTADTEYTFYQRIAGDANHETSPASVGTKIKAGSIFYTATEVTGDNQTAGENTDLTAHIVRNEDDQNKTFVSYTGSEMDGQLIPGKYITKAPGSLLLTISKAYMETLAAGDHTLKVYFQDGSVEIPVKIKAAAPTEEPTAEPTAAPTPRPVPKTLDNSSPALWIGLILTGIAGLAVLTVMKASRKRK